MSRLIFICNILLACVILSYWLVLQFCCTNLKAFVFVVFVDLSFSHNFIINLTLFVSFQGLEASGLGTNVEPNTLAVVNVKWLRRCFNASSIKTVRLQRCNVHRLFLYLYKLTCDTLWLIDVFFMSFCVHCYFNAFANRCHSVRFWAASTAVLSCRPVAIKSSKSCAWYVRRRGPLRRKGSHFSGAGTQQVVQAWPPESMAHKTKFS